MNSLEDSYQACQQIAESAGSNFYRAFEFLRLDRRRAMTALYAFSRLADDATDEGRQDNTWNLNDWVQWVENLTESRAPQATSSNSQYRQLQSIRTAVADSMQQFGIPKEYLVQILRGVDRDTAAFQIERYGQLQSYMYQVASAVGLSCIAIWTEQGAPEPGSQTHRMGVDCGHAFQLTNILRDVVEDAQRSRMYLAEEDLVRTGFERESLIRSLQTPDPERRRELIGLQGDWRELMRLYTQRAAACYQNGWGIFDAIDWDSRRMFSMIWITYHQIFKLIEKDPWAPVLGRPTLSSSHKLKLYASHAFTPWFRSLDKPRPTPLIESMIQSPETPRVAIIGGGLAGIQTAMHLAKHGCQTWLFESRSRLGGRVGSFMDPKSDLSIDYCQHVGMRCCRELVRWIDDMGQSDQWHEEPTLWFRSRTGRPFRAAAWPLPAPLHLAGLLLRWPDLSLVDRSSVAWGLLKLIRTAPDSDFQDELALGWLERNHQTKNAIESFWTTILVSALGEQMPRITMGSVHKVIIDGFAATRDAYHLLVPRRSLSELVDLSSRRCLQQLGVQVVDGAMVSGLGRDESRRWKIQLRNPCDRHTEETEFHSVVVAVPWHRISDILDPGLSNNLPELATRLADVEQLESAPITGIHTWWSKPWFKDPHAILIDRLCQWIFPGPKTTNDSSSDPKKEHYYQIIISGSRDLPKGDPDGILQMIQADLREVFPEITRSGAVLLRGKVITDPQSVFSVNTGHSHARLDANLFGDQGLFLAGDWTATGWPATMEGALRSGSIAASGVLNYVGRPADVSVDGR